MESNMNDRCSKTAAEQEAEESLLGAILLESSASSKESIRKVSPVVHYSDFFGFNPGHDKQPKLWPVNSRIFYAMTQCPDPPHQINTALQMDRLGILQDYDIAYMQHLVVICPCPLDYLDYAKAVKEYSTKRLVKYHAGKGNLRAIRNLTKPVFDEGICL